MATAFIPKFAQIEAVLYDGENHAEVYDFAGENVTLILDDTLPDQQILVHTNNGTVNLYRGHWLIKGAHDFYPCDPDTFEARWQVALLETPDRHDLLETDDAMQWAVAFERMKVNMGWTLDQMDPGLMVSWFASAIETTKNVTRWNTEKRGNRTVSVPKSAL